ncbi:MAG: protease modulator HflC, partial [Pseudomonadota bacterium]
MSGPTRILALIVLGTVLILAGFLFFTVNERQQALVLQFGAPVGGAINEPGTDESGLKMKLPWQNVVYFDRRNLEFDSRPAEIIVANQERLLVDAFVRYQIVDPLLYYQSLGAGGASPDIMRQGLDVRLTQILEDAMRERLGSRTIRQIIDEQRAEIMRLIGQDVTAEARKLGIRTIDVRIRQADFPQENAQRVNERMSSDYNQQAALTRAEGEERAREIRAEAEKEVVRIRASAEERSQIIRGRADAIRNCIFANAYQGVAADIRTVDLPEAPVEPLVSVEGEPQPEPAPVNMEEELAQMLGIS